MSPLVAWRLCAARYGETAFDGEGARLYGGRWSLPGVALVYCAESRALALLEVLANAEDSGRLASTDWVMIAAEFTGSIVEQPARFPDSWRQFPHSPPAQEFGSDWARSQRAAVLRVPSAVVAGEFNFLVNPRHPDFHQVKISKPAPFSFDPRLA